MDVRNDRFGIMKAVVFLRGLPGSGKTTFLNEFIKTYKKDISIISKDNLRIDKNGKYNFDKSLEKAIEAECKKQFENLIKLDEQIVFIDNLNLTEKSMSYYLSIAKESKYKIICVNFTPKSIDFHTQNNTKNIPENDIKSFKKHYQESIPKANKNITISDYKIQPKIESLIKYFDLVEDRKDFKKATDAEIELRIATIYEAHIKGANRDYIVRFCANEWGLKPRQVDNYYAIVKEKVEQDFGEDYRKRLAAKHAAQLDDLYVKNYTVEDFRECRSIIESKNKMFGLNAADKIDQNIKIDANINLSKEKIKQISDTLENDL